jgi:hypothetical protein
MQLKGVIKIFPTDRRPYALYGTLDIEGKTFGLYHSIDLFNPIIRLPDKDYNTTLEVIANSTDMERYADAVSETWIDEMAEVTVNLTAWPS